jgi:hypothetical protein
MKRQHLLATVALAASMGCGADNRASIEILGRALPSDVKLCEFSGTVSKVIFGNGVYDVSLGGTPYGIALYVQNNLVDPNTIAPGATTQTKDWSVEAVRVRMNPKEYTDRYHPSPALAALSGEAVLPIATSSTIGVPAGQGTVIMNILSDGMLATLLGATPGGTVVLGITLQGRTGDGARLDASEWPFPLEICNGCLNSKVGPPAVCPTGTSLTPNTCLGLGQIGADICL